MLTSRSLFAGVVSLVLFANAPAFGQTLPADDQDGGPITAGEHPVIRPLVARADELLLRGIYLREQANASNCPVPDFDVLWAQLLAVNQLQIEAVLRQDVDTLTRLLVVLENLIERLEEELTHALLVCEFGEAEDEVLVPMPDPAANAEPAGILFQEQYNKAVELLTRFKYLADEYAASGCQSDEFDRLASQILLVRTLLMGVAEEQDLESLDQLLKVLETLIEKLEEELTHTLITCEWQAYEDARVVATLDIGD